MDMSAELPPARHPCALYGHWCAQCLADLLHRRLRLYKRCSNVAANWRPSVARRCRHRWGQQCHPAPAGGRIYGTTAFNGQLKIGWPVKVLKDNIEPGFTIDLAHKDQTFVLEAANAAKVPMPIAAVAREAFSAARSRASA